MNKENVTDIIALKKWNALPEYGREALINNVFCSKCFVTTIVDYNIYNDMFGVLLKGKCKKCGKPVARLIEIEPVVSPKTKTKKRKKVEPKKTVVKPQKCVYQFVAHLVGAEDKIWRRFQISYGYSVAKLCYSIMLMFGMEGEHLYSLKYNNKTYGSMIDIDDFAVDEIDAKKYKLYELELKQRDKLLFTYDFGDNWQVELKVEKVIIPEENLNGRNYPNLLEGEGKGIIENIGGIGQLQEIMKLNDKGKNIKITSDIYGDIAPKWNYKNFNLEICKRMAKRLEIMTYKYEQN